MNPIKMALIAPIVAGFLGLGYGSFSSFTDMKQTHSAKPGPTAFSVKDKETAKFPVRAGVGVIVLAGLLLVFGGRRY